MWTRGGVVVTVALMSSLALSSATSVGATPESERCDVESLMLGDPPAPTTGPAIRTAWPLEDGGGIRVYVERGLLGSIRPSVDQYVTDLRLQGYDVTVAEFAGSAAQLRADLQDRHGDGLEGALFVGDLPTYSFSSRQGPDRPVETYLHDLYFADLDGTYVDAAPVDVHVDGSGDVEPEIYVSRLTASPLTGLVGASEAEILNAYFGRVHAYRIGEATYADRGAAFADADWSGPDWEQTMGVLYDDVISLYDPAVTTPAAYQALLSEDVESFIGAVHSGVDFLQFWADRGYVGWEGHLTSADLLAGDPRPGFYNMFNCSAGDLSQQRFLLGTMAVASDRGMQGVSSTKPGGIAGRDNDHYYGPLSNGMSAGQAFGSFLQTHVGSTEEPGETSLIAWLNGITMQGDPTLVPSTMGDGPASISGSKFADLDGDGVRDPGEVGLEGKTIWLDQDADGEIDGWEPATTTGPDGAFRFERLVPATYRLAEVPQSGWSAAEPTEVDVVSGVALVGVDIGNTPQPTAYLVAGTVSPPPADRPIRDVLAQRGFDVAVIDDDSDLTAIEPQRGDVVVISSSVVPSKVRDALADVEVPVILWEAYLLDDMGMGRSGETARTYRHVVVVDSLHPIAGGASGAARVHSVAHRLSYAIPSGDADVVATVPGRADLATVFAYARGDDLDDGTSAPGPRVGLFPDYAGAGDLTAVGVEMVRAALEWALTDPPDNDDFADRIAIVAGVHSGQRDDATLEQGEPLPAGVAGARSSVWWSWTAPADGLLHIDLGATTPNVAGVGIWTGDDLSSLVEVDSASGPQEISHQVQKGVTYHLAFYDSEIVSGSELGFTLDFTVPPPNDHFADRIEIGLGTHSGSNELATMEDDEPNPGNGYAQGSVWWTFTAPVTGTLTVDTVGSDFDTIVAAWSGDDLATLTEIASNDDSGGTLQSSVSFRVTAGETVQLAVYGWAGATGNIHLAIGYGPDRAVLVAGSARPTVPDRAMVGLLEARGFDVTIVDDDSDLAALDFEAVGVLAVSSSVSPSKVTDVFTDAAVPVLVWEAYLFDDFGLASSGRESALTRTEVVVVGGDHPVAAGLAGPVRVYQDAHRLSTATVASGATVIAHEPGRRGSAAVFVYETLTERLDGTPAPARRVGLFPDYLGAGDLTTAGARLAGAAIDWLVNSD